MRKLLPCVVLLVSAVLLAVPASAVTITFEDLASNPDGWGWLGPASGGPETYGGLEWSIDAAWASLSYESTIYSDLGGFGNTCNGEVAAFTAWALPIDFRVPYGQSTGFPSFDLNSMRIGAWCNDDQPVQITGYRNGEIRYQETVYAQFDGGDLILNWTDLDFVGMDPTAGSGSHHDDFPYYGDHFVIDDVSYTPAPGLPAFALVGAAPLVGGIVRKLRKK